MLHPGRQIRTRAGDSVSAWAGTVRDQCFGAVAPECRVSQRTGAGDWHLQSWKFMSEADRVLPSRKGQEPQASYAERRHIVSASRRGGTGTSKSRVVEVVHVRRDGPRPMEHRPRPAPWSVRAETWPEGFRAKPTQPLQLRDIQPVAPEPAQPAVHVMPVWQPTVPQPVSPE